MGDIMMTEVDLSCFKIQNNWARRQVKEEEDIYRNCFSRDRDRILYSKGFRRLSGKTQVFVAGFDDHCRTRLTHTMEVAQIATTISKNLGLNVDLTEAIAFGHDVGHTPFGHRGEQFLNLLMNGCYHVHGLNINLPDRERGFKHNWQSLRVISSLEKHDRKFDSGGINLTNFTRWGILNHTNTLYKKCRFVLYEKSSDGLCKYNCGYMNKKVSCPLKGEYSIEFYKEQYKDKLNDSEDWSYEAFVVAIADEIAQRHHDIEDGIEANILKKDSLINKIVDLFKDFLNEGEKRLIEKINDEDEKQYYIPLLSRFIVRFLVSRLIENVKNNLYQLKIEKNIQDSHDFKRIRNELNVEEERKRINYCDAISKADKQFKDYLFEMIINSYLAQKMDGKSDFLLRQLTKAYATNPQQLPDRTIIALFKNLNIRLEKYHKKDDVLKMLKDNNIEEKELKEVEPGLLRITLNKLHKSQLEEYRFALLRTICDYIAGMTDQYAIDQYESLYGSQIWR